MAILIRPLLRGGLNKHRFRQMGFSFVFFKMRRMKKSGQNIRYCVPEMIPMRVAGPGFIRWSSKGELPKDRPRHKSVPRQHRHGRESALPSAAIVGTDLAIAFCRNQQRGRFISGDEGDWLRFRSVGTAEKWCAGSGSGLARNQMDAACGCAYPKA